MIRLMKTQDLEQVAELDQLCFAESWSYRLLETLLNSEPEQ